jgi:CTP:molybdopterin cytidylyltransferase MocA
MHSHLRIGAVLLAAGQGSRLGNKPKALLRLEGVPLINRHLTALSDAGVNQMVVVTGFYYEQVEPAVEQFSAQIVRNTNPGNGQPSSVRLGIETLGDRFDAVIMMLCDQPLITTTDLTTLVKAFEKRRFGEIIIPKVNGQRGNPVVFSGAAIGQILADGQQMYCRRFIDQNPEKIIEFESQNIHYVTDIDTLADINLFEQQTGLTLTLPN